MQPMGIPPFTDREVDEYLERARQSGRKRAPKILHEPGAEMNRVVNVLLRGTYMQPHCHTQPDAVERIHVMRGELVIVFFDEHGHIDRTTAPLGGGRSEAPASSPSRSSVCGLSQSPPKSLATESTLTRPSAARSIASKATDARRALLVASRMTTRGGRP